MLSTRDRQVSRTRPATAVEAVAQARARDRGARGRLRMAAAAVHRLRAGLGGAHPARWLGAGHSLRARVGARADRGADVSGVPAGPRSVARKRGVSLLEFRGASCSRLRVRALSSTATSAAAATRRTPPGSPRSARSSSRRSAGSCFRSSRSSCCSLTGELNGSVVLAGALSLADHRRCGHRRLLLPAREGSARWLGAKAQRPLSWILVKLKRDPIEDGRRQGEPNCVPGRSPSCARAGHWGRSGSRPISSSHT